MAAGTRRMVFEVAIDDSKTGKALQNMDKNVKTTADNFGKAGKAIKYAIGTVAAGSVIRFASDAIGSFSDLDESINAVDVQFGDAADTILDFGESAAEGVGMANSEFNQMAVVTGATLSAFIKDEQAVADETIRLTERAADMASVFNTDVGDAMTALQSALRGEMEPIRRFGVSLNDAAIRAKAVEMGLAATSAEVTIQQKGLAALELVYEQTNKTAGDFANTSDGIANRQRILAARFEDAKAAIGEALVPAMEELLPLLEGAIPIVGKLADGIDDLTTFIGGTGTKKIDSASNAIEAMNELVAEGASETEAWAQVMGGKWKPTAEQMAAIVDKVKVAAQQQVRELRFLEKDTLDAAAATDVYTASARDAKTATDEEKDAIVDLARKQAAAADPVLNLIEANRTYKDAVETLAAVQADSTATAADLEKAQTDLIEAHNDLDVAQSAVAVSMSESVEAFKAAGIAAGLSRDEVDELAAALFALPEEIDVAVNASIGYSGDWGTIGNMSGGGGVGPISGPIFMESGGMVPGPVGAPVPAVVHGGELVLNPSQQRAIFGGGKGLTVNVHAGTIVTENQLEDVIHRVMAKYGRRNGLN